MIFFVYVLWFSFCFLSLSCSFQWVFALYHLYFYCLLYSRVDCRVCSSDVIKPGRRAAQECFSDPGWNFWSEWKGRLKNLRTCHKNCALCASNPGSIRCTKLARAQVFLFHLQGKCVVHKILEGILPYYFCCWSNDEFRWENVCLWNGPSSLFACHSSWQNERPGWSED